MVNDREERKAINEKGYVFEMSATKLVEISETPIPEALLAQLERNEVSVRDAAQAGWSACFLLFNEALKVDRENK